MGFCDENDDGTISCSKLIDTAPLRARTHFCILAVLSVLH